MTRVSHPCTPFGWSAAAFAARLGVTKRGCPILDSDPRQVKNFTDLTTLEKVQLFLKKALNILSLIPGEPSELDLLQGLEPNDHRYEIAPGILPKSFVPKGKTLEEWLQTSPKA